MLSDKKMFIPVFLCVAFLLAAALFYAIPRVKEHYLSSGQITITSDTAARYGSYLACASTVLYDLAASPSIVSQNSPGASTGLSLQVKDNSTYFSDFFLFDSSGELAGASGNRRVLPLNTPLSGAASGVPFPVMLTELSGVNFPAVIVPVKYNYGQTPLWLAGSLDTKFLHELSPGYLSGKDLSVYIADRDGNIAALSPVQNQKDISGAVRTHLSTPSVSAVKQKLSGGVIFTSTLIGETGWSVVSLRNRGSVLTDLRGELLIIALVMIILSAGMLMVYLYYIRILVKPVNQFIDHLSRRFEIEGKNALEDITRQVEAIYGNMNLAESIPIGIMVVDLEGVIKFFNREAGEITGHAPSNVIGRPMIKYFPNNYHSYTMECMQTGRECLGLRNIIKSGSFFKELLLNISPILTNNSVSGAVATFQDVTPQRKMIEVHAAYSLARDLVSQKDLDSTVKVISRAASEMVEIEHTAVFLADSEGKFMITSWHGIPEEYVEKYNSSPYSVDSPEIIELYRNKTPLIHGDVRNKHNLKAMLIIPEVLSFYSFPVVYEGKTIGLVNLYSPEKNKLSRDKIYLIQTLSGQVNTAIINFYEFQKMRLLASIDGLTGLFNKKYFLENLAEEIKHASAKYPLSLSMLDLDHFKNVNDTYGHQAGDQVLKEIASVMSRSLRETDSICRFGGEEIAISMPGTSKTDAFELIDSIRKKISNTPVYQTDDGPLFITISGGVATYPEDGSTLEELVLNSDSALYSSKKDGRNLVTGYQPSNNRAIRQ
ncbi:MAG: hypothetical protein JL50_15840 [Peptococcaceae bacterium BICA1-7]|nr:MAG: hypothetical protein JL50_15840 [Peptococcaceae bacterium BICA1-7]HBV96738.1 sensor domain-containing diguanylate cyclase [Desulfotomaculum sp.]